MQVASAFQKQQVSRMSGVTAMPPLTHLTDDEKMMKETGKWQSDVNK